MFLHAKKDRRGCGRLGKYIIQKEKRTSGVWCEIFHLLDVTFQGGRELTGGCQAPIWHSLISHFAAEISKQPCSTFEVLVTLWCTIILYVEQTDLFSL